MERRLMKMSWSASSKSGFRKYVYRSPFHWICALKTARITQRAAARKAHRFGAHEGTFRPATKTASSHQLLSDCCSVTPSSQMFFGPFCILVQPSLRLPFSTRNQNRKQPFVTI
eukprot:scaffold7025_cov123-Cylindrotheca_fusiformis.AAC.11